MNPFRILTIACLAGVLTAHAVPPATVTRFEFRKPQLRSFDVHAAGANLAKDEWLKASPENAPDDEYWLSSKIGIQMKLGVNVQRLLRGTLLHIADTYPNDFYILQAPSAWEAATAAEKLAHAEDVVACSPIMRQPLGQQSAYSAKPNDPLFTSQWHLEDRDSNANVLGVDMNLRSAWAMTKGAGVTIAIVDEQVETTHPDLISRSANALHYDFISNSTNAILGPLDIHATALAGLAVGEQNNEIGISGVAPSAMFASWRIFNTNGAIGGDLILRNMYPYASNNVAVQCHSWNYTGTAQAGPDFVTSPGIDDAINFGRGGKGLVIVRSSGNYRLNSGSGSTVGSFAGNANNDGYVNDPRVITVAAMRSDGRVAHYSSPGACILVAAPSSESTTFNTGIIDPNFPTLVTTDRTGTSGYNPNGDYTTTTNGFTGTSGVAPQIAGLSALLLSVKTNLTYRDVQQILLLSAHHYDFADPSVETNGAGLVVSHNLGFGLPDAGQAVKLARNWVNRPAKTNITVESFVSTPIPDAGFLVSATGPNVPTNLNAISGLMPFEERHPDLAPGEMLRPDQPTASLPLVYVGQALTDIGQDLSHKGALILRGGDSFNNKIVRAQAAGAAFAIVFNSGVDNSLIRMQGFNDFIKIPTIFIGADAGNSLMNQAQTNANFVAQLKLNTVGYTFNVTNQLLCEHVGVRIQADTHVRRGDMRITLISPNGTRSILQRYEAVSSDTGPADWTYWSTHNFYESSVGTWKVQFSDEETNNVCTNLYCGLTISGVSIVDSDHDGLDDNWEMANFGTLTNGPLDDPDHDGYSNIREYVMGTNPKVANDPFHLDLSPWDENLTRVSWPSLMNGNDTVFYGADTNHLTVTTSLAGKFPQNEFFLPYTNGQPFFLMVSNAFGIATSVDAVAPSISFQPLSQVVIAGTNVTLSANVNGSAPLYYQWRVNGTNVASGTGSDLTFTPVSLTNAGTYSVLVSNQFGTTVSSNATLTVFSAPQITQQPQGQIVKAAANVIFTATVIGTAPLSYQWRLNEHNIAGATTSKYTVINSQAAKAGVYTLVITNNYGVTISDDAPLTIGIPLKITTQPHSQTVLAGDNATFTVGLTGTQPEFFQWFFGATRLLGATNATLNVNGVQATNAGNYKVVVSNAVSTVTSLAATLTVTSMPLITQPPQDTNVVVGLNASFKVVAVGTAPLRYQWKLNGTNVAGGTGPTLVVAAVNFNKVGNYTVTITNSFGSVFAGAVLRAVPPAPTISASVVRESTNATLTVSGKASTVAGINKILYRLNNDDFQQASGTTNWTAVAAMLVGTNVFQVKAVNDYGESAVTTQTYFLLRSNALTVLISGTGLVTPNLNGKLLLVGRNYSVTAVPGKDQLFTNWSGDISSNTATLNFMMQSNLVLHANFMPNPFIPVSGTYNGLFYNTNALSVDSSGFLTLTLGTNQSFSGKLAAEGKTNVFVGKFDLGGHVLVNVARTGKGAVSLDLNVDFPGHHITGTVSSSNWLAGLAANQAYYTKTIPATNFSGSFTALLTENAGLSSVSTGNGYASIFLSTLGVATLSGGTPDGTTINASAPIAQNGDWPMFVSLYGGKGVLLGWMTFSNQPPKVVGGSLVWIKGPGAGGLFSTGFTNVLDMAGSLFVAPTVGHRVVNLTNGLVTLSGGLLSTPVTNGISLAANNVVTVVGGTNKLKMTVTSAGVISGSFVSPVTHKTNTIKGVVLQPEIQASGYFTGTNESGVFLLEAQP